MPTMTPSFREELVSQIPAVRMLKAMGYTYLTPDEALALRGNRLGNVILEGVLRAQLAKINRIQFKGQTYEFSDANIRQAIQTLKNEPYDGLVRTNEKVYELLTLGTSLKQTIDGDTKSFTLHYIDWQHPENNVYHVSDEFSVEKLRSQETRRPDVVVFVNGIPLVVLECKRPDLEKGEDKAVTEAITQMIRNQKDDEIPNLFIYAQILMAVSVNDALYATVGTPKKFWGVWREATDIELPVSRLINRPLTEDEKRHLYAQRDNATRIRRYFDALEQAGDRLPTKQDRTLYSLLRPERLLELVYQYILYDAGVKKVARYQQYFAIQETLKRVAHLNHQGTRTGGVIWHSTGSGKSLTMVMLAKALALHPNIRTPKIVLVTDRVDLDEQIWTTFKVCGKSVVKAESGADLVELVEHGDADIITTVINKFQTLAQRKVKNQDINVFVLVDEGHRSQYGSFHAKMREVFVKACYIGFTGTPLLKAEKETAKKFGGFIHAYPMRLAVEDKAVTPLLYEGRMAELAVDEEAIDRWFERVTKNLNDEQRKDLKKKFSRSEEVSRAEQRLRQIAYDIGDHFAQNWQGTGFKAQLAASNKETAIRYRQLLDEFGLVTSDVIISPPDTREGNEEVDNTQSPLVEAFWKKMMERFGNEEAYNREIKASFAREDGVEILIVVDKLLTGFDEPRNTVLYIDKPLKEHGLLQAISRVNRLFEGKEFGYIIDYQGVLGELNEAMETYNALEGYDADDLEGMLTDVSAEIAKLPQLYSDLWDVFKTVGNKQDTEALERFLEPEDVRQGFYEALTNFARSLKVALGAVEFYENTPEDRANTYRRDMRFFHNLRVSVKQRYAETIDYKDYERKVRKLLDSHISSPGVSAITELVNIFDRDRFEQEVARIEGKAAQADTIIHRVKRAVTENMDRDPVLYKRFSEMIDETLEAYRQGRLDDLAYLQKANEIMEKVRAERDGGVPEKLTPYRHAAAYYGVIHEPFGRHTVNDPALTMDALAADVAIQLEKIIEERKIRDWVNNPDVQNDIKIAVEDYLYGVKDRYGVELTSADMDLILDNLIEVAKGRERLQP